MRVRVITSNRGGAIVAMVSLILKVAKIIGSEIAIERQKEKGGYTEISGETEGDDICQSLISNWA